MLMCIYTRLYRFPGDRSTVNCSNSGMCHDMFIADYYLNDTCDIPIVYVMIYVMIFDDMFDIFDDI